MGAMVRVNPIFPTATNKMVLTTQIVQPYRSKGASRSDSNEANLYLEITNLLKAEHAIKTKKILKLSENIANTKSLKKLIVDALMFILFQYTEINKKYMGKFNKKHKIIASELYKTGAKAFKQLKTLFQLPISVTMSRMISRAVLKPGINENLFNLLAKRARNMSQSSKLCILLFGEISIAPHFDYERKQTNNTLDHAVVFMIRGLNTKYELPVAYSLSSGITPNEERVKLIKEIIFKLHSIGLHVIATVCTHEASNVSSIDYLIDETKEKYLKNGKEIKNNVFEVGSREVIPLFDPPHLMISIRNNMLDKKLTCIINNKENVAKCDHLLRFYNAYNTDYVQCTPKITEYHLDPNKIIKTRAKPAIQIFSRTFAAFMGYSAVTGLLESECKATADVILFFDELFDSVNGSHEEWQEYPEKPMRGPLTPRSRHQLVWKKAKPILSSMKFINSDGKAINTPSVKKWLHNIENFEYLKTKLFKKYPLKYVWLRQFNQDPLEKFFRRIRYHGVRNRNETCAGFEVAFTSLLIHSLSKKHSLVSFAKWTRALYLS